MVFLCILYDKVLRRYCFSAITGSFTDPRKYKNLAANRQRMNNLRLINGLFQALIQQIFKML